MSGLRLHVAAALAVGASMMTATAGGESAVRGGSHECDGGADVDGGSIVGRVACRQPGTEPGASSALAGGSARPFRVEVTERIDEPGCSSAPDGLRITVRTIFLDGREPPFTSQSYCWETGAPRPGSGAVAVPPSAEEVVAQAPIPAPVLNISPHVRGLVGIETWLWYDQAVTVTLPPVTLDGWTVTADLSVAAMAWDMGNGDTVTADAPGTEDDPSATYVYENQCRPCTITMTVTWSGSYTVTHPSAPTPAAFDLGANEFSAEVVYDVPEVEAVVVG